MTQSPSHVSWNWALKKRRTIIARSVQQTVEKKEEKAISLWRAVSLA